jgi:hypothetical protein
VQQSAKPFADRLNSCLDDTEAPVSIRERANILSKLLDIPKQQAWGLLAGQQMPDQSLLERIAAEFDVDPQWLLGNK